ncbi:hypothetical protein EJB05_46351 [Eragrostis curvula]|uniref:Embryo surrounding factor 1 brassicaceae domain-containing protein n=1 Tax=Eragrostis curvula TaxID=38414 RepID=A0A5J9SL53_9POAL|nr:hypothetical protein EJB05_54991 [Eragrostis curvula]TVT99626.1 hypothetical protein EJB05_54995 [Eragrostis curvula]TVU12697.1 hypothetical protein EJB05_46351 [Eragrostis curvula]
MMGKCRGGMVGLVTGFLFMMIVISLAQGRPQTPYASTNAVMINSTVLDESKDCELIFCAKRSCNGGTVSCYCCAPDPNYPDACYKDKKDCLSHCPRCKTERSR